MAFIGKVPTPVPLTSSDITDGIISSAKIADGTIATADIADGAVTSVKTTGVGGVNTPTFSAYISSNQTCSDSTDTTVNFDTEDFDTASAYDTTNKRFTVPSGEAGKYYIFSRLRFSGMNLASQLRIQIRKNGSAIKQSYSYSGGVGTNLYNFTNDNGHLFHEISTLVDLSVSDYIDISVLVDTNSANYLVQEGSLRGEFSGYKIIE